MIMNNDDSLILQAKSGRNLPPPLLACILVFSNILYSQYRSEKIIKKIQSVFALNPQDISSTAISIGISFGFMSLILITWVLIAERRSLKTLGFSTNYSLIRHFSGFWYGFLLYIPIYIFCLLTGLAKLDSIAQISPSLIYSILLMFLVFCFQGGTEELLFRGWLLPVLGSKIGTKKAILISSTLFGLVHIIGNGINFLEKHGINYTNIFILFTFFVNVVIIGILFSIISLREKSIYTVIGLHASWNWFQASIFGSPVSGLIFNGNSIFSIKLLENNLLTGGSIGLEGGLIATTILIFFLYLRRRDVSLLV